MRGEKNRSFLLMSLVPALLVVSAIAVLATQEVRTQSVRATNWSDPATWPNKKVPAAGDKVIIGKDKDVVLDVSPPALGGLSIDGKLTFSNNADLELTTEWIMLHGELAIGSEARPHTRKATITLTDNVKGEDVMAGMGDRGIMLSGGTLNLHGPPPTPGANCPPRPMPAPLRSRCWMPRAGRWATRSSSPRPISIPARPSGARLPPSEATRSRSTQAGLHALRQDHLRRR